MLFNIVGQGLIGTLALAAGLSAHAESASNKTGADEPIEEIVVTGTKQGFSIQETTKSVELFSEARLRDESVFDLGAALSRAANVSVQSDNLNRIRIRGISRNGTGGAGTSDAINIYFDGTPASSRALDGVQTVWDVQQVEVLRGSQSTVQGRNAIGGAVAITTKNPTYEWEGALRARMGSFDSEQLSAAVSGPMIEDELAFRFAIDRQSRDTFIDDGVDGEPVSTRKNLMARGKLLWEPKAVDALSAQITLELLNRDGEDTRVVVGPPVSDPAFGAFDPTDQDTFPLLRPDVNETDTVRAILDLSYDLSPAMTLVFKATYEDAEQDIETLDSRLSSFNTTGQMRNNNTETTSAEIRVDFEYEKWSGIAGVYYFDEAAAATTRATQLISTQFPQFPVTPIDSTFSSSISNTTDTENYAAFTQWRYEPNTRWVFDFGIRFDTEDLEQQANDPTIDITPADQCMATFPGFLIGVPLPIVTVPCAFASDFLIPPTEPVSNADFFAVLPNAGATYNINEDTSVFLTYRRGYRAGGSRIIATQLGTLFQVNEWDPEFLDTFELGWRSQLLDKRLTFNGQVFISNYDDQQVNVLFEDGAFRTVNTGSSSIYGLELSVDYQLDSRWNLYGNVGFLETEIDGFFQRRFTTPPIDLSGNELPESPPISMTLSATYNHESGFFGTVSVNYQEEQWTDIFNSDSSDIGVPGLTEQVDAVTMVNAQIGYRMDNFRVTLYATNLLDEDEPELRQLAGVFGALPLSTSYTLRQPRAVGLSIDVSF